jgi:4-hydroxy-2-oxoheptanedioate aldolase
VPEIDVLLIGPSDLSISLGVPGQMLHPTMQEAYRRVVEVATRHGRAAGIHPSDIKVVQHGRDMGMRLLMYSSDIRMLHVAGRQAVEALRPPQ